MKDAEGNLVEEWDNLRAHLEASSHRCVCVDRCRHTPRVSSAEWLALPYTDLLRRPVLPRKTLIRKLFHREGYITILTKSI